jgi:hypothetical protein
MDFIIHYGDLVRCWKKEGKIEEKGEKEKREEQKREDQKGEKIE